MPGRDGNRSSTRSRVFTQVARRHRLRSSALALIAACAGAALFAPGASAAGSAQAAGPKSAPFTQCPAIGADTSCEYLIDVTSTDPAVRPTVTQDPTQHFFDGEDDVTIAVQNDAKVPVSTIHIGVLGSGDHLFAFDGDGMCSSVTVPKPEGCPFNPKMTYEGPDTTLWAETRDAGTVSFKTPLQPGQSTYFSLEGAPTQAIVAGEVNVAAQPTITTVLSGGGQLGSHITVAQGTPVSDTATVTAPDGRPITGTVTYRAYANARCSGTPIPGLGAGGATTGSGPASNPVVLGVGTYYFQAFYSGSSSLKPASAPCGEEVLTVVPRSALVLKRSSSSAPTAAADFKLLAVHVNESNGQISITVQLPAAGTATATALVKQGASLARVARLAAEAAQKKRCKHGFVTRRGRCTSNAPVLYGAASLAGSAPGIYRIVLKPAARVLVALKKGRKLDVTLSMTFQSRSGGAPVTRLAHVLVRTKQTKHRKQAKHRHH